MTAVFCGVFALLRHQPWAPTWLEDLPVYAKALHAFVTGSDPYAIDHYGLHFVYPPLVLAAAAWCVRLLPGHGAKFLFIGVHAIAVFAMPFVLACYYVRARWWGRYLPVLVLIAEPGFVGLRALYSANVAPTLYLAAFLAAIPGLRRNRWRWFYFVVLLAALVKITLLVLLILPLLGGSRQWVGSVATGCTAVAANVLQRRLYPGLYAGYKAALVQQVAVQHQFGVGVFGFAARLDHHLHAKVGMLAYGLHATFVLLMLTALFLLKHRRGSESERAFPTNATTSTVWLGMLVIAVILANPRVLHYDMYIALIAAYGILAVHMQLDGWKLIGLAVVLQIPALVVLRIPAAYTLQTGWDLAVVLAALAIGIRQLWQTEPLFQAMAEIPELASSMHLPEPLT